MNAEPDNHAQSLNSEELRCIFTRHGLRTTRQRESVYLMLTQCTTHPTADELMDLVHENDPEVSQATIYNTLEALVGCELARRIPSRISGGACRFDADTGEHVHLVLGDGRVLDVPMDLSQRILDAVPSDVLEELSTRTGVELSGIKIELLGQATG
jgi:Fur family transcriptional regulator, peroxide stress response regulator